MSNLNTLIDNDFKAAMKAKAAEYPVLSFLRAAIRQVEVDTRKELTDEDIVTIVQREIKKRRDSITDYQKGGRQDLVDKEAAEVTVLQKYLPAQMSEDELLKIINDTIKELGVTDPSKMGMVLGKIMPKVKGKADGSLVNKLVKDALAK